MLVNIEIIEKPELSTQATFQLESFSAPKDYKEALAIIFMISADYYLDPELEIEDFQNIIKQGKEKSSVSLILLVNEDGIELEFK